MACTSSCDPEMIRSRFWFWLCHAMTPPAAITNRLRRVAMWTWNGNRRRPLPCNCDAATAPVAPESEPVGMGVLRQTRRCADSNERHDAATQLLAAVRADRGIVIEIGFTGPVPGPGVSWPRRRRTAI